MTKREFMIYRGAGLEAAWQAMVRYSENCERIVALGGRKRLNEMVESGIVHPGEFNRYRCFFEQYWYYRASVMQGHLGVLRG